MGPHREEFIHIVSGGAANAASPAFVAVPGYGSGSSFLFKLFDGLSSAFRFYAVDMLGTGLSGGRVEACCPACLSAVCLSSMWAPVGRRPIAAQSHFVSPLCLPSPAPAGRPSFRAKTTQEAEQFFVTSLDAWREAQGVDKMVLMGHSMGGYLSGQGQGQGLAAAGAEPDAVAGDAWPWLLPPCLAACSGRLSSLQTLLDSPPAPAAAHAVHLTSACLPARLPAACYAMQHPDRVAHLLLMCPAGVGAQPKDWQPPEVLRNPWTVRGQMFRSGIGGLGCFALLCGLAVL